MKIIPEKRFVVIALRGEYHAEDALAMFHALMTHPDYSPELSGVLDLREALIAIRPEDAEQLGRVAANLQITSGRWAYLATNPVSTALALIYKDHVSNNHEGEVFSTLLGASDYLGIDLAPYLPA